MSKRKVGIISCVIIIITIFVIYNFFNSKMVLITNKAIFEAGEEPNNNVSNYAKGSIKNATIDFSLVDFETVGIYHASINNNKKKLIFEVEVKDTTAPIADAIHGLLFQTGQQVFASELVTNIIDSTAVSVAFANGKDSIIYTEGGEYIEEVILKDTSDNQSSIIVNFDVVADTENPIIQGVKDIILYEGDTIDLLNGVSASDNRDGDISNRILVDDKNVDMNNPGKYSVTYTVSDTSSNTTTSMASVIILEDKCPTIQGVSDITIYVNSKIDYLSGVTAIGDRDGDITKSLRVDSSKVNTEKAGSYKAIYSVTDSMGHIIEKVMTVTVKDKKTTVQSSVVTEKSKDVTNSDKNKNSNNSTSTSSTKKDSTSEFQFYDVEPSGESVNGHIDPGGQKDIGTW